MWTQQELARDVDKIRALKGIESVDVIGNNLKVVTRAWTLRHTESVIPLARYTIVMYGGSWVPNIKYYLPIVKLLHWHPTLGNRIWAWERPRLQICLGSAKHDMIPAHIQGPYLYTLALLVTLQSIRSENDEIGVGSVIAIVLGIIIGTFALANLIVNHI